MKNEVFALFLVLKLIKLAGINLQVGRFWPKGCMFDTPAVRLFRSYSHSNIWKWMGCRCILKKDSQTFTHFLTFSKFWIWAALFVILVEAQSKSHDAILNLESLKFQSSVSLLSISKGLKFLVVFFSLLVIKKLFDSYPRAAERAGGKASGSSTHWARPVSATVKKLRNWVALK